MTVQWWEAKKSARRLGLLSAMVSLGLFVGVTSAAFGQLGGVNIGGGGISVGGGGQARGGGGVRVGGGGVNVGSTARSATRAATRAAPNVGATVNQGVSGATRGTVRVAPNAGANVRANANQAISGAAGAAVPGTGRANISAGATGAVDGAARTAQRTRADVRVPGVGAGVRTDAGAAIGAGVPDAARAATRAGVAGQAGVDANVGDAARAGVNAGVSGRTGVDANVRDAVRAGVDTGISGRTAVDAGVTDAARAAAGAATGADANARIPGARLDATVRGQGGARFSPNWMSFSPQERARIRANLNTALGANVDGNISMRNWIQSNPQRAAVWAGWGNNVRGNFFVGPRAYFGGAPFYTQNFWSGRNLTRNLIGLGLTAAGYGNAGAAVAGYPMWWGYSPWAGYRPWNYWWGTPTWNGLVGWFPNYGWTTPYFYDYGVNGNVVYRGNQVLVNGQVVGTPSDYAETAAELAAIDPATISQTAPEDWMPLGTFSLAVGENEADPPRVAQLAINKQGLISGTVFNRNSGNLYTLQGRVDKDTQRVAFTIGDNTDTILETGLFNLTQEQTPVLVHFGPNKTATYLLARLPMPEAEAGAQSQTATGPMPEIAR